MSDEPELDFGDAIEKGLSDYEGYYADCGLEESLKSLEQLFLFRERIMMLIETIKLDILNSYVEKEASE